VDGRPELALVGATLIDGLAPAPIADAVIELRGGRVAAVGRGAAPAADRVIDLGGRFVAPALIDVHAHAEQPWTFAALAAAGVAAIRNPATAVGRPDPAPPMPVRAAGPAIDGPPGVAPHTVRVADAAAMTDEVRRQAAAGFDCIKLYQRLPPDLVRAGVAAAHDAGLPAIGDLAATSWTEAARAGIDFLCHAVPRHPDLLPAAARACHREDVAAGRVHPYVDWLERCDLDGRELAEMADVLAAAGVAVDPTLVALEAMLFEGDPAYHAALDRDPAGRAALALAPPRHLQPPPALAPERVERLRRRAGAAWSKALGLVGLLHRRGVRLLAGTDAPRPWVTPGASLHRELGHLCAAGLAPRAALDAATAAAARALGLDHELGAIAAGRRAELLILSTDPLASIAHTAHIERQVRGGALAPPPVTG
jgi:hypothetical protein